MQTSIDIFTTLKFFFLLKLRKQSYESNDKYFKE